MLGQYFWMMPANLGFRSSQLTLGLYSLRFTNQEGATTVYIGEAESLQRRAAHYTNPGPTQATNIRINDLMRSHLIRHSRIMLQLIVHARLEVDGSVEDLDLSSTFARRFVENAALLACTRSGQKVENL
jgi:hypothetical protein